MMEELVKTTEPLKIADPILNIEHLYLYYGSKAALQHISLALPRRQVTAFIGPSGCGKSTLLRCFNRMNDLVEGVRIEGDITFSGRSIFDRGQDVNALRSRIG